MTTGQGGGVGGGVPPLGDPGQPGPFESRAYDAGGVDVVAVADEALFERLLAGGILGADDPDWAVDLARLVRAAEAPGRPDELAGEDEIVTRMVDARFEAGTELPDGAADTTVVPLPVRQTDEPPPGPHQRERVAAYRAKHMAARMEASSYPAVRSLGRVLAVKAAAVTTAVVVGTVAAAAAATTGIVATVVVPALTDTKTTPAEPGTDVDDDGDGSSGGGGERDDRTNELAPSTRPSACAASPVDCTTETPGSSRPGSSPSTTVTTDDSGDEPVATTTTESPQPDGEDPPPTTAPTTTVPEPTTTTTTETTTTTSPPDPGPQAATAPLVATSTPSAVADPAATSLGATIESTAATP
jgi:hypothetical protein